MPTATPAKRARQRRVPSVPLPPTPPDVDRDTTLRGMRLTVAGRQYTIGGNIEGDPALAATIDGAATLRLPVRDTDGALRDALGTEAQLLDTGVVATVNGIDYALQQAEYGDGLVTLTMEDAVKERLSRYTRFLSMQRSRTATFPRFAQRLIEEASRPPLLPLASFIPELADAQAIPRPHAPGAAGKARGTGAAATNFTVKGQRATAFQLQMIDGLLTEAQRLNASPRVMVALIMAATQESRMGADMPKTGNDDEGILQQGRNWVSVAQAKNPAYAARAFLTGGLNDRGAPGWKQVHGNLKTVPGGYESAIKAVQISVGGYAQWQAESERTVQAWTGAEGDVGVVEVEPYEFTRGERRGRRESSWDAIGRYAEERAWYWWANLNTAHLASGNELRAASPSLEIHGDEPWLLTEPAWTWNPRRSIAEVTFKVSAERWGVQIGAVVACSEEPIRGRFIVAETSGFMVNPEVDVTLRRPVEKRQEPRQDAQIRTVSSTSRAAAIFSSSSSSSLTGGARQIVEAAASLASQIGGEGVYVGSDFRAGSTTSSGNVSDHSSNDATRAARDIGVRGINLITGPPSARLDRAVVAIGQAFGRSYSGGVRIVDTFQWRGYRVQIIWRTPEYGGHMGHIHIGARRGG